MASFRKIALKKGEKWLAEVRILGQYHSKMFETKSAAETWASVEEETIRRQARGLTPPFQFAVFTAGDFLDWMDRQQKTGMGGKKILMELRIIFSFLAKRAGYPAKDIKIKEDNHG